MPASGNAPELAPTYYLDNLERLLRTVHSRYEDLLDTSEIDFLGRFAALAKPARCLYTRLIARKGPVFRVDRLAYPEIDDIRRAVSDLQTAGFADAAADREVTELLELLPKAELAEVAGRLGVTLCSKVLRRPELCEAFLSAAPIGRLETELRATIPFVQPLWLETLEVFRLLFFGNLRQDWTEFVLTDLQVWRYEPYELRLEDRLFSDRQAVDEAIFLYRYLRQASEALAEKRLELAQSLADDVLGHQHPWHPPARPLADRLLNTIARRLERSGDLEQALRFYRGATRPPARERQARLLARLGRLDEALQVCREITATPQDENEKLFAPRFGHRLLRQLGRVAAKPRRTRKQRVMKLRHDAAKTIEELAIAELGRRQAGAAFHSENWLWRSLFGLAFWDLIFAPVAGAFQHPFQSAPLDLSSPSFRTTRSQAVTARLAEVRQGEWSRSRFRDVYERKLGTRNRLVHWQPELWPLLETALEHLQGSHLGTVFDRLSRDLRRFGRGFPDLFVVTEQSETGFELLEVKGPADQLRPEQIGWLDYLQSNGLPAAVLRVEWTEPQDRIV